VERVQAKFEKGEGKSKKKEISFIDPPKKLVSSEIKSVTPTLESNIVSY
jgi:hypothetical protein